MKNMGKDFRRPEFLYLIKVSSVVPDLGSTLMSELPEQQTFNEIKQVMQSVTALKSEMFALKNALAQQIQATNGMDEKLAHQIQVTNGLDEKLAQQIQASNDMDEKMAQQM